MRSICFPITSRIHYARQKRLLEKLRSHPKINLQLIVGGSVLLDKYGERFFPAIQKDGFRVDEVLFNVVDGGSNIAMAKTAGLTALEFSNSLHKLNSHVVLIRGDRFEQLAIAMVAAYLNKTIAHIEGGDVSGTIDESVRHAITKLAHLHFVTNEDSRRRVIQMGENPRSVFNVGSPEVEFASLVDPKNDGRIVNKVGTGPQIDVQKPFLMVLQHPVTTGIVNKAGTGPQIDVQKPFLMVLQHPVTTASNNRRNTETLLQAIDALNMPVAWFWPNSDAGTNEIAKAIRIYREQGKIKNNKIRFVTDLLPEDFIGLLRKASILIGNSSSGIKEASYFGTPVVNIGTRQQGRLRGPNVMDVGFQRLAIIQSIKKQLEHGRYPPSHIYYKFDTSEIIVKILSKAKLQSQKKFFDLKN